MDIKNTILPTLALLYPTILFANTDFNTLYPTAYYQGEIVDESPIGQPKAAPFSTTGAQRALPRRLKNKGSSSSTSLSLSADTGCYNLPLGSGISIPVQNNGDNICFSTVVTEQTKLEGYVDNLSADNDISLSLFRYDNGEFTEVAVHRSSLKAGQQEIFSVVEAGTYVLQAIAYNVISPHSARIAWLGHTSLDEHEPNDRLALSTPVTESTVIRGSIDNIQDVDLYTFDPNGSDTVNLEFSASDQFKMLALTMDGWTIIPNNSPQSISLTSNNPVQFAIQANGSNPPPVTAEYSFSISSAREIDYVKDYRLVNYIKNADAYPIKVFGVSTEFYVTGTAVDEGNNPVPFAEIKIKTQVMDYDDTDSPVITHDIQADASGKFNNKLDLGQCRSPRIRNEEVTSYENGWTHTWLIDYNEAYIQYYIGTEKEERRHQTVWHLCDEHLVRSCHSTYGCY